MIVGNDSDYWMLAGMEPITHTEVQRRNGVVIRNALGFYFVVGCAIALLVPQDLVYVAPSVGSLSRLFDYVIPGIPRLASLSSFPEVMRIFLVVMWILVPIAAYRVGRAWVWNPRTFRLKRFDQWFLVGFVWFFALFSFFFLFVFFDVDPKSLESGGGRGNLFVRSLTQHRTGLAIFGSLWFSIIAATLGLAVRLTYLVASNTRDPKHAS
jgi:hypothetical protein